MKKLLLILLCLPMILFSCNSGWSLDAMSKFLKGCNSKPLPSPYSETQGEYCKCLLEKAMKKYPNSSMVEKDKLWGKEAWRECISEVTKTNPNNDDGLNIKTIKKD